MKFLVLIVFAILCSVASAKQFGRCELARSLQKHGVPQSRIATFVCISHRESHYNTGARNHASGDHGIFQISELFWCSPTANPGGGCHTVCSKFRDSNIGDDISCIKKIYREHRKLKGNGFKAWTVYKPYCSGNVKKYVAGCF